MTWVRYEVAVAVLMGMGTVGTVEAQDKRNQVGLLAGLNLATVDVDVPGVDSRAGLVVGLFSRQYFTDVLGLDTQVLYSQQGFKGDFGSGIGVSARVSYLKIPALFDVRIPVKGTGQIRPRVFLGPALGIKLSCSYSASLGNVSVNGDCEDDEVAADIKGTDWSAVFGAGVDIGNFTAGVRYDLGLTRANRNPDDPTVKNRVLAFTVGYGIRLP